MKQYLSLNLAERSVKTLDGATWTPPEFILGEDITLALRFTKTAEGQTVEASETVNAVFAAIGYIDAAPVKGKFAIKIGTGSSSGTNTTAEINYDATASQVAAAINALTVQTGLYGTASVRKEDGSWFITFATATAEVVLSVVENSLTPVSFGRVSAVEIAGVWIHELRLQQAPGSFTDAAPRVLPPAPEVARVRYGSTTDDFIVTELQSLTMPREFRGAYDLTFDGKRTALLSQEDGPEEIQAALVAITGGFIVTLPQSGIFNIEFAGDLAGETYDLLEVNVRQAPEGDITLTLPTNRNILWSHLRTQPSVTLPLHIRLNVTTDSNVQEVVGLRQDIVIKRPLIWDDLATNANTDWINPPSAKDYIPYTTDQVLTGQQQAFPATIGTGSATSFAINHNLESAICDVIVIEVGTGRMLRDNEYVVTFNNSNQLTVSGFASTPTTGQYQVLVIGIGPASVFQSHTHTIEQIVGLSDYLTSLSGRVSTLESILPSTGAAGTAATTGFSVDIPPIKKTLFLKGATTGEFDPATLPARPPYLLPSVHDASTTDLPGTLPSPAAGTVWKNVSGSTVLIPGGGQVPSGKVLDQGFVASDGRSLFVAVNDGTSKSYYPAAFERTLFTMEINSAMLRLNGLLTVEFSIVAQILNANCEGQWQVIVEVGAISADTTPSPIGLNLKSIDWSSTPILRQVIVLTELPVVHVFGARIKRKLVSLVDTLTADKQTYGVWEGANSGAPSSANFAIRARLANFDVENVDDPRGWLHFELAGKLDAGGKPGEKPTAIITY